MKMELCSREGNLKKGGRRSKPESDDPVVLRAPFVPDSHVVERDVVPFFEALDPPDMVLEVALGKEVALGVRRVVSAYPTRHAPREPVGFQPRVPLLGLHCTHCTHSATVGQQTVG